MVEINIRIIEELKTTLNMINSSTELKQLFSEKASDFSRNRKLGFSRTALLIFNMLKRSLSVEIQGFFELVQPGGSCTKAAFTIQRKKLNPLFFEVWNNFFVDSFYKHYGERIKRWRGLKVIAVDGSTAYLFNKQEVKEYFGVQKNQFVETPIARVMKFYDVLNKITIFSKICPIGISEQSIVCTHIESLPEDSVSIYDRGFPGFLMMWMLMQQERERLFVMRCHIGYNPQVKKFVNSDENDTIVEMAPNKQARENLLQYGHKVWKDTTIKVRMVKVILSTGETEVLLTNLYDGDIYPSSSFKELYRMRWDIETSYGADKNTQQLEQFSGHTVHSIQQDFYAMVFVANLQSLIEKQCDPFLEKKNRQRLHNYKVNKNVSIGVMKNKIVSLFLSEKPENILLYLQHLFEKNIEPIRPDRKYPRKMRAGKRKYSTVTSYKRAI